MTFDDQVVVVNMGDRVPAGFTPVYVGRTVAGQVGSPLSNPFGVYQQREAAGAYLLFLRAQCQYDTPGRREVLRLATMVFAGERLALQCWCAPKPCHAEHVRSVVLGYARRLEEQARSWPLAYLALVPVRRSPRLHAH